MSKTENKKFGTLAIHAGQQPDPSTGAIMTPVYQTSTYVQSSPGVHQGYEYARTKNPTRTALEKNMACLENGAYGICFASGMSAIDAVIRLLKAGDEVISTNDLYGGSYRVFTKILEPTGIKFTFTSFDNSADWTKYITTNTKLIWLETPTNPMMNVIDIEEICREAKKHNLWVAVDNTFATPYLQKPLDLGADFVVHSVTKYMGGHSDTVMGSVIVKEQEIADRLYFIQNSVGAIPGPQDCFLVLRGLKTLHVRMDRHCENARSIAHFLQDHPKVDKVYYPGFESNESYSIARKQMKDFGGMLSFILKGDRLDDATKLLEKLEVFTLAESLGGVESLAGHPATMTHASIPKEEREKVGLTDSLIRLSIGIEDVEDLKADLEKALEAIGNV